MRDYQCWQSRQSRRAFLKGAAVAAVPLIASRRSTAQTPVWSPTSSIPP